MAEQQRAGLQRSTVSGPSSIMVINGEETWLAPSAALRRRNEGEGEARKQERERERGGADVTGKHKKVNEKRGEKTARKRCGS